MPGTETWGSEGPDLLRAPEVAVRLSISERTLWRLIKHGRFPAPIRYGRRLVRWRRIDVNTWLEQDKAAS